jgi:hypothetical protein
MQVMDLGKSREVFDPSEFNASIHIIGCGAVGSTIAENIARLGIEEKIYLYDFDTVEPHNIANQMFLHEHIGTKKVVATANIMKAINPNVKPKLIDVAYANQPLFGFVFLCMDNIDVRRTIVENNLDNPNIKAMFDFRMRLFDAQHYAADWSDYKAKTNLLASMQFSHEEALAETPVSACGMQLSIHPTVRVIAAMGISNFLNFIKGKPLKKLVLADPYNFMFDAF